MRWAAIWRPSSRDRTYAFEGRVGAQRKPGDPHRERRWFVPLRLSPPNHRRSQIDSCNVGLRFAHACPTKSMSLPCRPDAVHHFSGEASIATRCRRVDRSGCRNPRWRIFLGSPADTVAYPAKSMPPAPDTIVEGMAGACAARHASFDSGTGRRAREKRWVFPCERMGTPNLPATRADPVFAVHPSDPSALRPRSTDRHPCGSDHQAPPVIR